MTMQKFTHNFSQKRRSKSNDELLLKRRIVVCRSEDEKVPHNALMKPGFTRFNLSYFASEEEVEYLLNALEFIAEEGWKFLSLVKEKKYFVLIC